MRAVQPKHIRFAAGTNGIADDALAPSELGKSALNRKPAEESPFELLWQALAHSSIISRSLGSFLPFFLDSQNRAGDFITARGAALRLAECLTKLLAAEGK